MAKCGAFVPLGSRSTCHILFPFQETSRHTLWKPFPSFFFTVIFSETACHSGESALILKSPGPCGESILPMPGLLRGSSFRNALVTMNPCPKRPCAAVLIRPLGHFETYQHRPVANTPIRSPILSLDQGDGHQRTRIDVRSVLFRPVSEVETAVLCWGLCAGLVCSWGMETLGRSRWEGSNSRGE